MSSKLDTVLADAAMLRNEVSNLQKVVDENITLRQHLTEKEKEIEELKKRLDAIQTQKQPKKQQLSQNSYNTGVN
jgi:predicted nuclease with TOPRIM domain